jgi:hypothetical protein
MGEYQHRCAAGACEELAKNIEIEFNKLSNEPFRLEGEQRALAAAAEVLNNRYLVRAKAQHEAGELTDEQWQAVHQYVRGCVGQLATLSQNADVRKERMAGQLLGMRNSLKIARAHAEDHKARAEVAASGEDVFGEAEKEHEEADADHFEESSEPETQEDAIEKVEQTQTLAQFTKAHTYKQLKELARELRVPMKGTKPELAKRVFEAREAA